MYVDSLCEFLLWEFQSESEPEKRGTSRMAVQQRVEPLLWFQRRKSKEGRDEATVCFVK